MRLALVLVLLVFVVFGAVFGALNSERIVVDFYFWQPSVPKGAVLISAVVLGWLLGGLVAWLSRNTPAGRQSSDRSRAVSDFGVAARSSMARPSVVTA